MDSHWFGFLDPDPYRIEIKKAGFGSTLLFCGREWEDKGENANDSKKRVVFLLFLFIAGTYH
jgi:hypothetical protein